MAGQISLFYLPQWEVITLIRAAMTAFKISLTFGCVFHQIGLGQGWRLSGRTSTVQEVECINTLGWSSALNIFLNCHFCLRRVNYISLLWLIEDWFNKAAASVKGPVYFLTVFTEILWVEKKKKRKKQLYVQIPPQNPSPAASFDTTLTRHLSCLRLRVITLPQMSLNTHNKECNSFFL